MKAESFTLDSDLPNVVGVVAFRLPGTDSQGYAALQVLVDVLSSRRSDLYKMESSGNILDATLNLAETYPNASVGYGLVQIQLQQIARIVAGSPRLSGHGALEAKIRHRKSFDEGVNHAAHMIGWYKVVQYHGKQCSLITSLALDITHKKRYLRLARPSSHRSLFKRSPYSHETFF